MIRREYNSFGLVSHVNPIALERRLKLGHSGLDRFHQILDIAY